MQNLPSYIKNWPANFKPRIMRLQEIYFASTAPFELSGQVGGYTKNYMFDILYIDSSSTLTLRMRDMALARLTKAISYNSEQTINELLTDIGNLFLINNIETPDNMNLSSLKKGEAIRFGHLPY